MPRKAKKSRVPAKWAKLLRRIPGGYDPIATAGDCHFDRKAAQRALDFYPECLTHVKGALAGKPFNLEPGQRAIVANMYGWKRPDGTRRYREVFLFEPRKNGKTTFAGGMVNYGLFADDEPGAEVYSAAGDRDQALLVFAQASGMVENEPALKARSQIYKAAKSIVVESTGSTYKAISAEASTKHGYNTHLGVIDELHVQPNRDLVDALQTSTGSRRQPLLVCITTAGYDRHSICYEKYDHAKKVRDGIIEDQAFLPVIYEAPEDADWKDPRVWAKANPNLGVSVSLDYLKRECQHAQDQPAYENTFRRLHLNQWTEQDVRWLPMAKWDLCGGVVLPAALYGEECWAGLDLSSTTDLTALVLIFRREGGGYKVLPYFWVPEESARKRAERDRVPYPLWIKQNFIHATPGDVVDYEVVRADINALADRYRFREIGIDPWNATGISTGLTGDGFEVVDVRQGFPSLSAPTKELEKLVLSAAIEHGGNPVLRWCASNVSVEVDAAGNLKPSKKRSVERIDGIVATIIALSRAMVDPGQKRSVYEDRGILTFGPGQGPGVEA